MPLFLLPLNGDNGDDDTLDDDFRFETMLRLLPHQLRARVTRKRFHADAKVALMNLLLQRSLLTLTTGTTDPQIEVGALGKPRLKDAYNSGGGGIGFSMSNEKQITGMLLVTGAGADATTGHVEVGLDLSRARGESVAQYREVLSVEEYEFLVRYQYQYQQGKCKWQPREPFQWMWAMKEAYGKYRGLGLNYDMQSVRFALPLVPLVPADNGGGDNDDDDFTRKAPGLFTRQETAQWYTTEVYVDGTLQQQLTVQLTEHDSVVACAIGEHLTPMPTLYTIDTSRLAEWIHAEEST